MSTLPYPNPEVIFHQQYQAVRRDEVVGVLLAVFLGGFGIHHFYLGKTGLGILYLCLFWTPIPWVLGFIECFFMPGRVRMYNAVQAAGLAAALGIPIPGYSGYPGWAAPGYGPQGYAQPASVSMENAIAGQTTLAACGNCGQPNRAGSQFCSGCGTRMG